MSGRVILHIGLHKTGTRFLQRMVFAQLDPARFNVNPPELWEPLRAAARRPNDAALVQRCREAVRAWRESGDKRTLIVSEPHICGDMYSSYQDYQPNLALMKECFPEARIIYFVRKQSDWLHSAYRQHLARGKAIPIEVFLNFYGGEFRPRLARFVYGARNMEALNLPFLDIYQAYREAYGEDSVYLFRQEDLKNQASLVKARLADVLEIDQLPAPPRERQQNRSYSALAIKLFFPGTRRRYPPPTAADIGRRKPSKLVSFANRMRRVLIQHGFDKLIYRDWDLLDRHGMRQTLDSHYAAESAELERIAARVLASTRQAPLG